MTAKTKSSILNLTAFVGALVAVAGLASSAKGFVDTTYVRADSFLVYTIQQQGKSDADSQRITHRLQRIDERLARVDSNTACLRRRKPDYCA